MQDEPAASGLLSLPMDNGVIVLMINGVLRLVILLMTDEAQSSFAARPTWRLLSVPLITLWRYVLVPVATECLV